MRHSMIKAAIERQQGDLMLFSREMIARYNSTIFQVFVVDIDSIDRDWNLCKICSAWISWIHRYVIDGKQNVWPGPELEYGTSLTKVATKLF